MPTFPLSSPPPADIGAVLDTGTVTLDTSTEDAWLFYDFSRRGAARVNDGAGWDLAFQRSRVIVNGGPGFDGDGGVLDLGAVPFDDVRVVPATGYRGTEAGRDSTQAAFEEWYDYSFTSHILRPSDRTFALRTADGRYAKLRILSYYCPGPVPGCLTFRYAYQGDGSRSVAP